MCTVEECSSQKGKKDEASEVHMSAETVSCAVAPRETCFDGGAHVAHGALKVKVCNPGAMSSRKVSTGSEEEEERKKTARALQSQAVCPEVDPMSFPWKMVDCDSWPPVPAHGLPRFEEGIGDDT